MSLKARLRYSVKAHESVLERPEIEYDRRRVGRILCDRVKVQTIRIREWSRAAFPKTLIVGKAASLLREVGPR